MEDLTFPLPPGLHHLDQDETALAKLPLKRDRMRYHTKRLRSINYATGARGVAEYKSKFPEAATIQFAGTRVAFQPKPSGYEAALRTVVGMWFDSDVALAETNRSIVTRLNSKLGCDLDPDKHFSQPIPSARLRKLAHVFTQHGAALDTSKPLTMSQVRANVRAAKANARPNARPFGSVGHCTGTHLCIGSQTFAIQSNGTRQCIRPTINGTKRRLYLDELLWVAELMAGVSPFPSYEVMGERDYSESSAAFDPLCASEGSGSPIGERDYSPALTQAGRKNGSDSPTGERAYPVTESITDVTLSFTQRILRAKAQLSPALSHDQSADPLTL